MLMMPWKIWKIMEDEYDAAMRFFSMKVRSGLQGGMAEATLK